MSKEVNHTNIVLIPKVDSPCKMAQFRSISLCNTVYKITSKVLTNRLKEIAPKVISQNQSVFIAGRQISDNILVVHELLHSMKQGNEEAMLHKLDMAKAYDRVEWPFLNAMLHKLGFDDVFCQWIMECVQTVSYSVIINGEAMGHIVLCRGLRQEDPLSPFLFLICVEGISVLIQNKERVGNIRGMMVNHLAKPSFMCFLRMIRCYFAKLQNWRQYILMEYSKNMPKDWGSSLILIRVRHFSILLAH